MDVVISIEAAVRGRDNVSLPFCSHDPRGCQSWSPWMETRNTPVPATPVYLQDDEILGEDLFLINFALGVVTGITLEFQFGTNWSRYSAYVGRCIRELFAGHRSHAWPSFPGIHHDRCLDLRMEPALRQAPRDSDVAGGGGRKYHRPSGYCSANGWMQHPVGFTLRDGRAELVDFTAVVFNKFGLLEFVHTLSGAYILSAFVVMGISAYHLLRKQHIDFFTRSFRTALVFGLVFSVFIVINGDMHAVHVTEVQPTKLAAMEAHWETTTRAPIHLFAIPDAENERNRLQFGSVPGMLSFLGFHDFDAEVRGLKDFPKDERPPVLPTFISFRTMVALGTLFPLLMIVGWFKRKRLVESPGYLKIMLWAIPLPYIANEMGWVLAEVGRQPWIVYGLMKTSNAASPVAAAQVGVSLAAFVLVYGLLGAVGFYLMRRAAIAGPPEA